MISLSGAVALIVYLVVAGLIFWLLYWMVNYLNPPEPFKRVAVVVIVVLAVLVLIGVLLNFVGGYGYPLFRP